MGRRRREPPLRPFAGRALSLQHVAVVIVAAVVIGCATPAPSIAPVVASERTRIVEAMPLSMRGSLDADLRWRLDVCGADDVVPIDRRALDFVISQKTDVRDGVGCVVVVLDLAAAADALQARDAAVRVGDDVVIASPDIWLWTTTPPRPATLSIDVADGLEVVVPFPRGPDGRYAVETTTWRWLSSAVFGRVASQRLTIDDDSALRVVTLPGRLAMSDDDVARWLQTAARAVRTGSGGQGFPFREVVVVVDPVAGADVPFGMVSRGGGPQALLLLGGDAVVDDVIDDWVAVHELSHLLAPPVGLDEAWFSEGLATYHQAVLRARAGLLTSTAAWSALVGGFERGRRSSRSTSLRSASATMRRDGGYLQVYQGGAALIFVVDVALRRCGSSIDAIVAALRVEQPDFDRRRIAAADVVARAAAVVGCAGIADTVDVALRSPFPAVDATLRALGLDDEGRIVLQSATDAGIREAIMQARPDEARSATKPAAASLRGR